LPGRLDRTNLSLDSQKSEKFLFIFLVNLNIDFKYGRINTEVLSLNHEYRPGSLGVSPSGLSIDMALISYFDMPAQSLLACTGIVA